MKRGIQSFLALAAVFASGAVLAHTGSHAAGSLAAGLGHPVAGLDHLLAMVAVGIWAVQLGGRSLPALPALFVTAMAAGAAAGASGVGLPQVEGVVALSVLVLGLLVALTARAASYWAFPLVALFAVFHGHAHGAEVPADVARWQYFAGFLVATAALHASGVLGGLALRKYAAVLRAGGAAIGLTGVWLLLAA